MTETNRVQRWREGKRQHGLKAVTIWLTAEEELRLKDLALQGHCSPSAVMQQALAQFTPRTLSSISTATDMSQIRELIRAELDARQAELGPVTATVTEAVTATVTDTVAGTVTATLARDLPAMVREIVEGLALEALGWPVTDTDSDVTDTDDDSTDTYSDVTDTEALGLPATDTDYGNVPDTEIPEEVEEAPAPHKGGRPRGEMRQRIVALLEEHTEGLSAEELRVFLRAEKPLGDTLQGMRKQNKVRTRGTGKALRYFVA
jgi:hypothetical protein